MNMPAADDRDTPAVTGRPPVFYIVYIVGGVAALVAVIVILHLTGIVG